jgi:hypothetical protein
MVRNTWPRSPAVFQRHDDPLRPSVQFRRALARQSCPILIRALRVPCSVRVAQLGAESGVETLKGRNGK